MTEQQRQLILPLLLSLAQVRTMDQVNILWSAVESALRTAGVNPGTKPTSVPQAKSVANSLRRRVLGA